MKKVKTKNEFSEKIKNLKKKKRKKVTGKELSKEWANITRKNL